MSILIGLLFALKASAPQPCATEPEVRLNVPEAVSLGEPFGIDVALSNCSRSTVGIIPELVVGNGNLALDIIGSSGKRVVVTNYVVSICDGVSAPLLLGPGEYFGKTFTVSPSPSAVHVYFPGPGQYEIVANVKLGSCGLTSDSTPLVEGTFTSKRHKITVEPPQKSTVARMRRQLVANTALEYDEALAYFASVRDFKADSLLRRRIGRANGWCKKQPPELKMLLRVLLRQHFTADVPFLRDCSVDLPAAVSDLRGDIDVALAQTQ